MEAFIRECKLCYRYEKNDAEDAPTILFLHGWGCDGSIFAAFEKDLLNHASILTVDFPGHGKSGEPKDTWGVPDFAEQIRELLELNEIRRVHIVAHSFGGRIAIYLASHYPQLIDKVVITGGAGIRKPAAESQSKKQLQYKRLKKMVACLDNIPFLKGIAARLQEMLVQKYGSADYKRLNVSMRKTFVKVINQDLSEMLSQIKASTLLVWGSNDTETPLWMAQKMEKEIPDAGLAVFEGRSHFAFVEESQRFLIILKTFFFGGNIA